MLRLIVAGSRVFSDYELLKQRLDYYLKNQLDVTILSGTAQGADRLGEIYARERGYKLEQYPANWEQYGKSAGYKRNEQMAQLATHLVAFWDGESKGTKHMIDLAAKYQLNTRVVICKPQIKQ